MSLHSRLHPCARPLPHDAFRPPRLSQHQHRDLRPAGSVAIGWGDQLIAEKSFAATAGHGRDFLPIADELCREAGWRPGDLNECYVSIGPGSFTGLRVAVAFARHLALACGTRIVAVPTMESIAWNLAVANLFTHGPIAVFLEAKKGLVFAVRFEVEQGVIQSLDDPSIVAAAEYLTRAPPSADCHRQRRRAEPSGNSRHRD